MTAFITQLKDNKDKLFLEETKALIKKSSEFTSKTCKFIQDIATKGHLGGYHVGFLSRRALLTRTLQQ